MKRKSPLVVLIALVGALTLSAQASASPALPPSSPATFVGRSIQFDLPSRFTGRTYRIFVYKPETPPPPGGYPVFFATDGNGSFSVAVMQMWLGAGFNLRAAMIVGIGYPSDDRSVLMNRPRFRDLTPPTPIEKVLKQYRSDGQTADDFGGSDLLFRFVSEELRPAIAAAYPTDPKDQTLYGHSLGGLFVLDTMFKHPDPFSTYVASSPSIWWGQRLVLEGEPGFRRAVEAGEVAPRLLIEVGGLEQDPAKAPAGVPQSALDGYNGLVAQARQIDAARELAERLAAVRGAPRYQVKFHVFDDEDHASVVAPAISRALSFAYGP